MARITIPYAVADFIDLRERGFYYVDKTDYIPKLEDYNAPVFLRPRRFGKSLLVSTLACYYDRTKAHRFEELFGGTWIGNHPTKEHNSYMIIRYDFSKMVMADTIEGLAQNFNDLNCGPVDVMVEHNRDLFGDFQFTTRGDASKMLEEVLNYARSHEFPKVYLLIDEYDNFTNVVLNEQGKEVYHALTHASGFYREIFKKFKGMFERIFMTGVSPVTLDDLTSGFNIGWNISTKHQFNMMLGFSETDVREMLQYYKDARQLPGNVDISAMIEEMRPWYDNYCFAEESLERDPKMFNCDMVLYYLRNYMDLGKSPKEMIDPNTRTDYNKMKKLIRLDKLDGNRKGVLRKITEEGQIITTLTTTFPAIDITKPEIFPSLLFYYGMLTITATRGNYLVLSIPNNNVRKQYYEFLLEEYQDNRHINLNDLGLMYYEMAYEGHWRETMEFIAHAYKENSSVRSSIEGERNLQGFFTAYLSTNAYYLIAPEVELNHGYCDLFLMPDLMRYDVKHSYIIELKYLSAKDSEAKAEVQWQEAVEQIKGYAVGAKVRQMVHGTELHCIVMQFRGWELERVEEVMQK